MRAEAGSSQEVKMQKLPGFDFGEEKSQRENKRNKDLKVLYGKSIERTIPKREERITEKG